MSPVTMRARAELRARLASMVALALLIGLAGGAVMTTVAGARRTDTSYKRFARAYLAADVMVFPSFGPQFASIDFDKAAKLPQVAAFARMHFLGTEAQDQTFVAGDGALGVTVDRAKVVEGRLPRPDSLDEAAVPFALAKTKHLRVGDTIRIQLASAGNGAKPIDVALHVVGIEASPGEFPPQISSFGVSGLSASIHVSDGLYRSVAGRTFGLDFGLFRLKRGAADVAAFNDGLNGLAGNKAQLNANLDDQAADVQRSIHLQAVALWIVGALVALIGLMVLSQLVARQAVLDATDNPTLLALGMTRTQVWLTGMGRAAVVGLAGAAIAVVVAIAASPLMPIGTARIAEPHPGVSVDPLVIALGIVATILAVLLLAAWPVWKSARVMRAERAQGGSRPSIAARAAAAPGFPPPVATGMRLALEPGHGRTEVPVRSSLIAVILAIAALTSALTFAAGLDHLLTTPRLYGWNWDAYLSDTSDQQDVAAAAAFKVVEGDPRIANASYVDTPPLALGEPVRVRVNGMGLRPIKGVIEPIVTTGRAPIGPTEVALGAKTLRDLHAHIGSIVPVNIDAVEGLRAVPLRVVGTIVMPPGSNSSRLGVGALFSIDTEKAMIPSTLHFTLPTITDMLIRFAPGVDKKAAFADLQRKIGQDYDIVLATKPTDLVNFGQVQNLPLLLAGLVALLAATTLAHTLITAIRRRRRDFAILKMLGFVPGQVRWAVAWQATTFISVALLVGLPLGIAVGRTVWTVFADQLGVFPEAVTPSLSILLTIPGAIVLANLIAAVPATIAGRMRPAVVLRAE